ncbi:MAG TPA: hypothetical protein VE422_39725 [Terriglobia bacterium]|nr:hypothetical protein [Terriglobia bacterium]
MKGILAIVLAGLVMVPACTKVSADYEPTAIESRYGLTGAYVDDITTEDGKIKATIVPTTLEDGRKVQLIIPHQPIDSEHQVFMRDGISITPLELSESGKLSRQDFVQSAPRVVERRPVTTPHKKRSWEKEALIIGGGAGAGTAIGAIAGGKKGAGVGAVSGGIAGLVYDLATRNKK